MPRIQNYSQSLTDEHDTWHQSGIHPDFPTRTIPQGALCSGLEFVTFYRNFIAQLHTCSDTQPFANETPLTSWTEISPALKTAVLTTTSHRNAILAAAENNNPSSFASAAERGLFIESELAKIHGWIRVPSSEVYNESILRDSRSGEGRHPHGGAGKSSRAGDHFYAIWPIERGNAITIYGYAAEATACYAFNSAGPSLSR